jgi:DNA mismatch repair protein MutL
MRIKRLDPILANQIAAGEVIDRPAAVLKELMENALDATADDIQVEIEQGGIRKIIVRDNGKGIISDDLELAFERHATSKLMHLNDLYDLHTLGFRGEALAAISSVSKVCIASKTKDASAVMIENQGGVLGAVLPVAHPVGTTVTVSDLFFNTPVRRRFLRSEKTESIQLEEIFKRMVLSHFEVGFQWKSYGVTKRYPKALTVSGQKARVAKILGKKFTAQSVYVDVSRLGLRLWGWIGLESCARKQADQQYIFVNQRAIKDRLLAHAIKSTFLKCYPLNDGTHPSYVLFLEILPDQVDVNVHPTKLEVRFSQSRLVHDFIYFAVQSALEKTPLSFEPALFQTAVPFAVLPRQAEIQNTQIREQYFLFESKDQIFIIDWQRALKPIAYVYYLDKIQRNEIISKPLLFPKEIDISTFEAEQTGLILHWQPILEKVGITIKLKDKRLFILKAPDGFDLDKMVDFFKLIFDRQPNLSEALTQLIAVSESTLQNFLLNIDMQCILEKWVALEASEFAYPIKRSFLLNFFKNKTILYDQSEV